jgi:zinc and cadmium transporter
LINFLVGLTTVLGVLVFYLVYEYYNLPISLLFAFTAGGFIYMAIGNLLPGLMQGRLLKKDSFYIPMILIIIGVLIVIVLNGGHSHEKHQHKAHQMGILVP